MCFNFTSKASRTEKSYGPRSRQVKVEAASPAPVAEPVQGKKRWRYVGFFSAGEEGKG